MFILLFIFYAHDGTDKEHQLLPTELQVQYMFMRANYCLYMDRIANEGKNITRYILLNKSQNISFSFFS